MARVSQPPCPPLGAATVPEPYESFEAQGVLFIWTRLIDSVGPHGGTQSRGMTKLSSLEVMTFEVICEMPYRLPWSFIGYPEPHGAESTYQTAPPTSSQACSS
ncbi:hypothetical protein Btru_054677 [Bulinus truncatus]|nr:hypothetical protein Btru_054677 [Bulinus truncatus]